MINPASFQPQLVCETSGQPVGLLDWRCEGARVRIANLPPFDAAAIQPDQWTIWRYAAMLPVESRFTLGEGGTPLVRVALDDLTVYAKLEHLNPTGSYKDRGTSVLVNHLLAQGVTEVVEDSSGNAGASLAAYASATGIRARIFVPASAPQGKKRLIAAFGGELVETPGPRAATTEACLQAAQHTVYATHAWSPFFLAGQMTAAWEIWEQLGRRIPDIVICPVGHGGLFTGWVRGFKALRDAGLIDRLPRLYAVQSAACNPLAQAWARGLEVPQAVVQQAGVADGIAVTTPVHGAEVLAAVRETGGAVLQVNDESIVAAQALLHQRGLMVELTSAVPVAALRLMRRDKMLEAGAEIVLPLTGNGLKALY